MQSSLGPGTVPCAVVEDTKMSANSLEWLLFKVKKKKIRKREKRERKEHTLRGQ